MSYLDDIARIRREAQLGIIDQRAQMRDAKARYQMWQDESERQYGLNKAQLGQSMAARGLGWSGIRTGAEGRQLADYTAEQGAAALAHQQERDAFKRYIQRIRAEAAMAEDEVRSQQQGLG